MHDFEGWNQSIKYLFDLFNNLKNSITRLFFDAFKIEYLQLAKSLKKRFIRKVATASDFSDQGRFTLEGEKASYLWKLIKFHWNLWNLQMKINCRGDLIIIIFSSLKNVTKLYFELENGIKWYHKLENRETS